MADSEDESDDDEEGGVGGSGGPTPIDKLYSMQDSYFFHTP